MSTVRLLERFDDLCCWLERLQNALQLTVREVLKEPGEGSGPLPCGVAGLKGRQGDGAEVWVLEGPRSSWSFCFVWGVAAVSWGVPSNGATSLGDRTEVCRVLRGDGGSGRAYQGCREQLLDSD